MLEDGTSIPIPEEYQKEVLKSPHHLKLAAKTKKEFEESYAKGPQILRGPAKFAREAGGIVQEIPRTITEYVKAAYETAKGAGAGQEQMGLLDQLIDNFTALRGGRKGFEAGEAERHPTATTAGGIASIFPDIIATGQLPAVAALPLFAQTHSESSILEPKETLKNLTGPALTGAALDLFFKGVGKVAQNRGVQRGAKAANAAEIEATEAANLAEQGRFAAETQAAQQELKAATTAEKARVQADTAAFEAGEKQAGLLQQVENKVFVESGSQAYEKIPMILGKEAVASEAMGVQNFIENFIDSSQFAATKEGNRVSRFLKTVFKGDAEGKLNSDRVIRGLRSIDETIAKESGPVRDLLMQYKDFAFTNFPEKIANQLAYSKFTPKIVKAIEPKIEQGVVDLMKNHHHIIDVFREDLGGDYFTRLAASLKTEIENVFALNRANFKEAMNSGTLASEVERAIQNNSLYQELIFEIEKRSKFKHPSTKGFAPSQIYGPGWTEIEKKAFNLPKKLAQDAEKPIQKYASDIYIQAQEKTSQASKLLSGLQKQPGAIPGPSPVSPYQAPQLAAVAPANVTTPNLIDIAGMPESQGILGKLATGLEGLNSGNIWQKGKEHFGYGSNLALMAKLAGIPVGKTAAAATGGAALIKGLTAPGAAGQALRGGLQGSARIGAAVYAQAQRYASFRNGILDDPMDRRSLVKEIEDNPQLSLSDKAVFQTQVNRGIPLQ